MGGLLKMMNNDVLENKNITKKDLNKVFWRWAMHGESGFNYEKMQGLGYAYSIMPALKKIYKDDEEGLQSSVKNHLQFFNTNPWTAHFILGANIALEEDRSKDVKDTIVAVKTGLMGPMAGVGDTIYVILSTVFGSIAAYMALEGSYLGIFLWMAVNIARLLLTNTFIHMGYKQGVKIVENISGLLRHITEAANILGLTVIGALVPTVISANIPFVFKQGDVTMELQALLDQLMPSLVPVCVVAFMYWLLGRKNMTSTKGIFILIAISILAYVTGFIG